MAVVAQPEFDIFTFTIDANKQRSLVIPATIYRCLSSNAADPLVVPRSPNYLAVDAFCETTSSRGVTPVAQELPLNLRPED